jgi:hypothetical protein
VHYTLVATTQGNTLVFLDELRWRAKKTGVVDVVGNPNC